MVPNFDEDSTVKLQSVAAQDFIPLFSGRPKREKVINREDLMDLDILLHTCDSVEAFLAKT